MPLTRILLLAPLLLACSRRAPVPTPSPSPSPSPTATRDAAPAPDAAPADVPPAPVTAAARIEALRAVRPRVELVPEECEHHACVRDEATGLVRASRGFATRPSAARLGDVLIVAVPRNDGAVETRYTASLWRWNLSRDTLARLGPRHEGRWETRVHAASFGLVIEEDDDDEVHDDLRVYDGRGPLPEPADTGEPPAPNGPPIEALYVVAGRTFEVSAGNGWLAEVVRDGDTIARERVEDFCVGREGWRVVPPGRGGHAAACVRLGDRPATVRWAVLPSREVRSLEVGDFAAGASASFDGDALVVRDAAHAVRVDLAQGTAAPLDADAAPATTDAPCPLHAPWLSLFQQRAASLLYLGQASGLLLVGPGGFGALTDTEAAVGGDAGAGCACAGESLACVGRALEGACAAVEGLAPIPTGARGSFTRAPAPIFTPDGAFRVDAVDLSVQRVTRLRDGARLWIRTVNGGLVAQADDGAFATTVPAAMCGFNVRWGRALLTAPVARLAAHRASLERPSLVADFFSDRPLPAADLAATPAR